MRPRNESWAQADADRAELGHKVAALSAALGGDAAVADRASLGLTWIRIARGTGYAPCSVWIAIDSLAAEVARSPARRTA